MHQEVDEMRTMTLDRLDDSTLVLTQVSPTTWRVATLAGEPWNLGDHVRPTKRVGR
jgi:hypothetical protein